MSRIVNMFLFVACALALSACGGGGGRRTIVVYSPHGSELLADFEKRFEAAHPDIDVRWYDLPTATCVRKIRAERDRPQADVWWGGPSTEFISAAKRGLLATYTPSWADKLAADAQGRDGTWCATWRTPEVILYNANKVKPEDVPRDWDDVLDPKWTGKLVIRDPLQSGTMKTIFGAMILRAGSDEAGFEWLKRLDRQNEGRYAAKPYPMYEELKRGGASITLWNMADAFLQKQNGSPFDFVIPASGTPVVLEGIAIVRGAPHRKEAELFFEFVTSAESLRHQAAAWNRIPVERADVDASALPAWMSAKPIRAMKIDWELFAIKSQKWMDHWRKHIRGTGKP